MLRTDHLEPMVPVPHRVTDRWVETHDSVTIRLEPVADPLPQFRPGQFTMVYAHGIGEIPISISGDPSVADGSISHTIRVVGVVSEALFNSTPGTVLGLRGPFGTSWDVGRSAGRDLVIVAGGVGLAPLRPVVLEALAHRENYGRVVLIAGARSPQEFLFRKELDDWEQRHDLEITTTIDVPAEGWTGPVGFVTEPLGKLEIDPTRTTAFLCGPEPMMRFCARALLDKGLPDQDIRVSLERNMRCGVALCGHCQFGPLLVCRDGPVVDFHTAGPLMAVREL